jgi:hypothetical protein
MTGFSADWLALREPIDARSRSRELIDTLPGRYSAIVDLGAGTGANFCWLAPQLESTQHWTLIDNDNRLLVAARKKIRAWAKSRGYRASGRGKVLTIIGPGFDCTVTTLKLDLSRDLALLEFPAQCLVTASAFFDLVSGQWLAQLVDRIAEREASILWALSYDGRVTIDPRNNQDEAIIALVNRHQLTDKGFGPALGPDAWLVAQSLLEHAGFNVRAVDSNWRCGKPDSAMLNLLIDGWAEAAAAIESEDTRAIEKWRKLRLRQAAAGRLRVSVGHRDLAARPAAASRQ